MTHIHIPDGVLPLWLWAGGYVVAFLVIALAIFFTRRKDMRRLVPFLGIMSAVMMVAMSIEIVPIAYHINLSIMSGIILGPWASILAIFVVNLLLSLLAHGGITMVGLNSLVMSAEAVLGYFLFRGFVRMLGLRLNKTRPALAAGAATFLSLFLATWLLIGMVALSDVDVGQVLQHEHEHEHEHEETGIHQEETGIKVEQGALDLWFFAKAVLLLGSVGWVIESFITGVITGFIYKIRPDIISSLPARKEGLV